MAPFTQITYLGHATVLIETENVRLLTDPLLKKWVIHLRRHAPPIDSGHLKNIDAVLISHQHLDHLHVPSLKMLDRGTRIILPEGTRSLVEGAGFERIEEIVAGGKVHVGDIEVLATPAEHSGRRILPGEDIECLGYLVQGKSKIYFAGDTDVFPEMANFSEGLDLALLPVWGWGPNLGPGHMDPYRAALALQHLKPGLAIPIHWGAYHPIGLGWMRPSFLTYPPRLFEAYAAKIAPNVGIRILDPGEKTNLEN